MVDQNIFFLNNISVRSPKKTVELTDRLAVPTNYLLELTVPNIQFIQLYFVLINEYSVQWTVSDLNFLFIWIVFVFYWSIDWPTDFDRRRTRYFRHPDKRLAVASKLSNKHEQTSRPGWLQTRGCARHTCNTDSAVQGRLSTSLHRFDYFLFIFFLFLHYKSLPDARSLGCLAALSTDIITICLEIRAACVLVTVRPTGRPKHSSNYLTRETSTCILIDKKRQRKFSISRNHQI